MLLFFPATEPLEEIDPAPDHQRGQHNQHCGEAVSASAWSLRDRLLIHFGHKQALQHEIVTAPNATSDPMMISQPNHWRTFPFSPARSA